MFSLLQQLIGVQDEDSCGRSGQCETPEAKLRRLTGHPRKAKSSTEINSGVQKWMNLGLPLKTNVKHTSIPIKTQT
jgi:hypothetical protein